jgi:hypothetical protein
MKKRHSQKNLLKKQQFQIPRSLIVIDNKIIIFLRTNHQKMKRKV